MPSWSPGESTFMPLDLILILIKCLFSAVADLHKSTWCVDRDPATGFKQGDVLTEVRARGLMHPSLRLGWLLFFETDNSMLRIQNNLATKAACAAYRNRNTGTNQWDTCPDCVAVSSTCSCSTSRLSANANNSTRSLIPVMAL